jgi:hypothetical protein
MSYFKDSGYGIPSESNNTTTPLAASATYTGTSESNVHSDVMVSCYSDTAGMLYLDFSDNNTDWHTFPSKGFTISAGSHFDHEAVKGPRYFRVRFVNGSSTQSILQLYTYFGTFRQPSSALNQTLGLDSDALTVRSDDFQDEVRRGLRAGVTGWNKFGYRNGLTSGGGEESIWATTGNFSILTSPSTFTITYDGTSGGSTDGSGTTGATQLYFYYIDDDGLPAIRPHTLGTDGSDETSFSGLGINRCVVAASGALTYNASDITITATTGGTTQAVIPAEQSVTQQAIFFNGSNHIAIAKYLHIGLASSSKSPTVQIIGYVYNRQFSTRYEIFRTNIDTAVELSQDFIDPIGFPLTDTDVLYFVADSSANSVDVSIRFSLNMYQTT